MSATPDSRCKQLRHSQCMRDTLLGRHLSGKLQLASRDEASQSRFKQPCGGNFDLKRSLLKQLLMQCE